MPEAMKYGQQEFEVKLPPKLIAAELEPNHVDLPVCLALCCVAVVPPLLKGKFYRWQGVLMLAVYAAYVVILVM